MAIHTLTRRHHPARPRPRIAGPPPAGAGSAVVDRDYWIEHSVGYRVHDGRRRIGFVEETRADPERPGGTLLTICAGALGRRHLVARSADVTSIVPAAERIWLRTGAASPA